MSTFNIWCNITKNDGSGNEIPATGLISTNAPLIKILSLSDGLTLDFSTGDFVSGIPTTLEVTLGEFDATNWAGWYRFQPTLAWFNRAGRLDYAWYVRTLSASGVSYINFGELVFQDGVQVFGGVSTAPAVPGSQMDLVNALNPFAITDINAALLSALSVAVTAIEAAMPETPIFITMDRIASDEVPDGVIDGVNVTYTLRHAPISGQLNYYAGVYQVPGVDYTLVNNIITRTTALTVGESHSVGPYPY